MVFYVPGRGDGTPSCRSSCGLVLIAVLGVQGAGAQELDFLSDANGSYTVKDRHDFVCLHDERIRVIYVIGASLVTPYLRPRRATTEL